MPAWSRNKVNPAELNSGNEFTENDQVAIEELNAMVNGGLYAQDFAEALADTPDNSDANNVGTASVELVDNIKGGKTYKKFKFKNLKGQTGASGDTGTAYRAMGVWNSSTPYVNNSEYIDTVQFSGSTYYAKTNNTGQSPTDGTDNTYWGVLALKGSDSGVDIVQTTGTSTSAVMSQKATTDAIGNIGKFKLLITNAPQSGSLGTSPQNWTDYDVIFSEPMTDEDYASGRPLLLNIVVGSQGRFSRWGSGTMVIKPAQAANFAVIIIPAQDYYYSSGSPASAPCNIVVSVNEITKTGIKLRAFRQGTANTGGGTWCIYLKDAYLFE